METRLERTVLQPCNGWLQLVAVFLRSVEHPSHQVGIGLMAVGNLHDQVAEVHRLSLTMRSKARYRDWRPIGYILTRQW
jgi:hypothetical protein